MYGRLLSKGVTALENLARLAQVKTGHKVKYFKNDIYSYTVHMLKRSCDSSSFPYSFVSIKISDSREYSMLLIQRYLMRRRLPTVQSPILLLI